MKRFLLILPLALAGCQPLREPSPDPVVKQSQPEQALQSSSKPVSGRVQRVADGDTLTMRNADGVETVVRLAGIDAPERGQPFSNVSRRALQELTLGKEIDIMPVKIDRYGRTVAGVRMGETDICLEMIRRGLAWHFKQYEHEQTATDRSLYAEAEADARREKTGLWTNENPTPPWEFRDKQRAVRAQ